MQIDHKISRRNFLKLTGANLTALALGSFINNPSTVQANPEQIKPGVQENFLEVSENPGANIERYLTSDPYLYTLGDLDNDNIEEIVMAYNREDESSLVKFFPFNNEGVPLSVGYDSRDDHGPNREKPVDALFVGVKQVDNKHIKLITEVAGPIKIPENVRSFGSKSPELQYYWRIDSDKSYKTAPTGSRSKIAGAEYMVVIEGDKDKWNAHLNYKGKGIGIPKEDFEVIGNRIGAIVNLEDIDSIDSFNFDFTGRILHAFPMSRDQCPNDSTHISGIGPIGFEIDSGYQGGEKELSRIFQIPYHAEGLEIKELDGKPGAIVETENGNYLFQWDQSQGDFEIELQ